MGIPESTYSAMEHNRARIRRRDLLAIADFYGAGLEELFGDLARSEPEKEKEKEKKKKTAA